MGLGFYAAIFSCVPQHMHCSTYSIAVLSKWAYDDYFTNTWHNHPIILFNETLWGWWRHRLRKIIRHAAKLKRVWMVETIIIASRQRGCDVSCLSGTESIGRQKSLYAIWAQRWALWNRLKQFIVDRKNGVRRCHLFGLALYKRPATKFDAFYPASISSVAVGWTAIVDVMFDFRY